jgi:hypothetical protein
MNTIADTIPPEALPPKANGTSRYKWPAAASIAANLGITVKSVRKLALELGLETWNHPNGGLRYDPDGVAQIAQLAAQLEDTEEPKPAPMPPDIIRQYTGLLEQAHKQIDKLADALLDREKESHETLGQVRQIATAALASKDSQIAFLTTQQDKYLSMFDAMLAARENALTFAAEREALRTQAEAKTEFRREVWGETRQQLAKLVEGAIAKWGLNLPPELAALLGKPEVAGILQDPAAAEKALAAYQLIEALDPAQLDIVKQSGLLNGRQIALIDKILGATAPAGATAPEQEDTSCEQAQADPNQSEQQ